MNIGNRYSSALIALVILNCNPAFALPDIETQDTTDQSYGELFSLWLKATKLGPDRTFLLLNGLTLFSAHTQLKQLQFESFFVLPPIFNSSTVSQIRLREKSGAPPANHSKVIDNRFTVISINNDGVKSLNAGDYPEAINRFKSALDLDPSYKLARDNLAISYNNYGLKLRNKPAEALSQFHHALFMNTANIVTQENIAAVIKLMGKDPNDKAARLLLSKDADAAGDYIGAYIELSAADKLGKIPKEQLVDAYNKISLDDQRVVAAEFESITNKKIDLEIGSTKNSTTHTSSEDKESKPRKSKSNADEDVDFGPYMAVLQRQIKRNWFPPKGASSLQAVVLFKIHSDGQVSNFKLTKPTGDALADQAAIKAISTAAPFEPLPAGASKVVDIAFTFDYNVFSNANTGARRDKNSDFYSPFTNLKRIGYMYFSSGYESFLSDLEKQIKKAWLPHKGDENKRVVVLFSINENGKISEPEMYRSSGSADADLAAMNAVKNAGIVKNIPKNIGTKMNVQFTFDEKLSAL